MKFTYLLATVAAVSMLASCSCNKNKESEGQAEATQTEQQAEAAENAETAQTPEAQKAAVPEDAKKYVGYIKTIEGNDLTLWDGTNEENLTKITLDDASDLIEGAPIIVYYTPTAEGNNKIAAAQDQAVNIAKNYRLLIGKWATADNSITYELRRRGRAHNVAKDQNVEFKGWRLHNDTIGFVASPKGQDMVFFDDGWYVEKVDETSLVLTKGSDARLEMTRLDSELD